MKPVIKKALVELDRSPFVTLFRNRRRWADEDCYRSPGPIQFVPPDPAAGSSAGSGAGIGAADVSPLSETLRLELEEEAALAAGGSPMVDDTDMGAEEHSYQHYLTGVLKSKTRRGTLTQDVADQVMLVRLKHEVCDADHDAALHKAGWSRERWLEAIAESDTDGKGGAGGSPQKRMRG